MPTPTPLPIARLLVANRGEIACRVFRTARALGIETVAVYAPPDTAAKHVRAADLAVPLRGRSVGETYLDIDQVVSAARRAGADSVHPGYGFLAENADLAQAVLDAGLTWVGPAPATIRLMGSKVAAKQAAAAAGVPLPSSAEVAGDDPQDWLRSANRVGFPLLVKASAGGGGKGMRLVGDAGELLDAVRAARREAASSFGDPTVFLERYLAGARHVEVQILGEADGTVLHLGERECSIQRRHQKVVEETPSPGTTPATRASMCEAAVALAASVGYVGAGTVEFLVVGSGADQEYLFLEMNTRLQVEHPVTEVVTGVDLVALQLRVAEGRPSGLTQAGIRTDGHAIEVRVYAEDPAAGHRPSTGTLLRWDEAAGVRWDSGVAAGDVVSASYDPLLAKVVAHAPDRATAAAVLARALRTSHVHGVVTNLASLAAVLDSTPFRDGETPTDFLDQHPHLLTPDPGDAVRRSHAVAAALHGQEQRRRTAAVVGFAPSGWRNVRTAPRASTYSLGGGVLDVAYAPVAAGEFAVVVDGTSCVARVHGATADHIDLEVDGIRAEHLVSVEPTGGESDPLVVWVSGRGTTTCLVEHPRFPLATSAPGGGEAAARLPGTVTAVLVSVGSHVDEGDPLVLLEAMKMEHRITATVAGTVTRVLVAAGDPVDAHQELVTVQPVGEGVE